MGTGVVGHFRQLGKAAGFGGERADHGYAFFPQRSFQHPVGKPQQGFLQVFADRVRNGEGGEKRLAAVGKHGGKQAFLVAEIFIDAGLGAAGAFHDFVHAGAGIAFFQEDGARRFEQGFAARFTPGRRGAAG